MSVRNLRLLPRAVLLSALLLTSACGSFTPSDLPILAARTYAADRPKVTEHVIIISIDGLRPDAITQFDATTLQQLMRQGSYTVGAKTILPSRTLPSHTAMLTGLGPEDNGITFNSYDETRSVVKVPTIFAWAKRNGLKTAAFISKGKFRQLLIPGSLDSVALPPGNNTWPAEQTVVNVEQYLRNNKPNVMFVHFGEPDYSGSKFRWMGFLYGRAVRKADWAVSRVVQAADRAFGTGKYTVIVTADHGGMGWTHGGSNPLEVTIPWIAWGEGVRGGTRIASQVRTIDTASTAAWLLGLPPLGKGAPVRDAFYPWKEPVPAAAAAAKPAG